MAGLTASLGLGIYSSLAKAGNGQSRAMVKAFTDAKLADAVSVAVLNPGIVKFYDSGIASRSTLARPTRNTVYEIGSVTKTFTSLLLAHAISQGRAKLDDPVTRFFPRLRNLEQSGETVTLRHLVTTTSALPDNPPGIESILAKGFLPDTPARLTAFAAAYSDENFLSDLEQAELVGKPGEKPGHSNMAAHLVGLLAETIFQAPYDALLARYVERPFGMASGLPAAATKSIMATGYDGTGRAMPTLDSRSDLLSGGLRYSAADMARYVKQQIAAAEPAIRLSHVPLFESTERSAIGFSWQISRNTHGSRLLSHSGSTLGFSSFVAFSPDDGSGIVVLANRFAREREIETLAQDLRNVR